MSYKIRKSKHGYYSVYPLPSIEDLEKHYSEKYYQNELSNYQHSYSDDELRFFDIESEVAEVIFGKINQSDKGATRSLLDVGAGEGFFSKHFFNKGWQVVTCDFADDGIMRCNPNLEDTLVKGDIFAALDDQVLENNAYDFVNLKNVLEHVLDPVDLLQKIKLLLKDNSVLRIEVPNDYSVFQELLLNQGLTTETWFSPPEHLHYFNVENIQNLFDSLDFTVHFMMTDFPIELYILNNASNYAQNRKLGKDAHIARVKANNFIFDQGVEAYINYFTASAAVNLGRQVVVYVAKKNKKN